MEDKNIYKTIDMLMEIFNHKHSLELLALREGPFSDITVNELQIITAIGVEQVKNQSELAQILNVTTGTVSVGLRNLYHKGYINRIRSEIDRRNIYIYLTSKGRLIYRLNRAFYSKVLRQLLKTTDGSELKALLHFLEEIRECLIHEIKNFEE